MPRFAIKVNNHHTTWDRMLATWQVADDIDLYESAWNFDHFYPVSGDTDGPCLEAWVTLSALAQATSRIRVGTLVNGMHHRHPAVVAAMASSLDIVSGGRLELGLGAGWYALETDAYGLDLGDVGTRMTRFEEGTEIIHRMLTQEVTDFSGRHYTLKDARNEPRPIQSPPPIVIGGRGERRTLKLAARFASTWDTFAERDPQDWLRLREVLWTHCADVGRDPGDIHCSSQLRLGDAPDPAEVHDRAAALFELGVDLVIFTLEGNHGPETVEQMADAVADLV